MQRLCRSLICAIAFCSLILCADTQDNAVKQIDFCMIGDSITWWGEGDAFRLELLKHIPELAFVGTHSAKYGFSHAGEGGNTTKSVLARLNDEKRVPRARYYHLLIGINDCGSVRAENQISSRARQVADNIKKILDDLSSRTYTEKVFLGTILPCSPDTKTTVEGVKRYALRDAAGSAVNKLLRKEIAKYGDKVVLIEYENVLRQLPECKKIIRLHPTQAGYKKIAEIAAPVIKKHTIPKSVNAAKKGVSITNLWNSSTSSSLALIPGWYTLSFVIENCSTDKTVVTIKNINAAKNNIRRTLQIRKGKRVWLNVYTAIYAPLAFEAKNIAVKDVMLEKMRPSKQPSRYGTGSFVDTVSAVHPGEVITDGAIPANVPAQRPAPAADKIPDTPANRAVKMVAPQAIKTINKSFGSHNAALEDALR